VWVGRVAENRYEKLRKKEEGDDGAEGRDAVKKVCMGCWLVEVTRRWTDWCVGLAANANSREPTVGVIRQERSMVTARFVWVALTDCRKGKPGKGLSNCVVIKPGRRRTGEGDAVRRFHFRFAYKDFYRTYLILKKISILDHVQSCLAGLPYVPWRRSGMVTPQNHSSAGGFQLSNWRKHRHTLNTLRGEIPFTIGQ
jgi:hypothetical protein